MGKPGFQALRMLRPGRQPTATLAGSLARAFAAMVTELKQKAALEAWVVEAIAENPGPVEQFRAGKDGAINFLVGQVMKKSRGAANVRTVQELLRAKLSGS